jgi:hypothetical protein
MAVGVETESSGDIALKFLANELNSHLLGIAEQRQALNASGADGALGLPSPKRLWNDRLQSAFLRTSQMIDNIKIRASLLQGGSKEQVIQPHVRI